MPLRRFALLLLFPALLISCSNRSSNAGSSESPTAEASPAASATPTTGSNNGPATVATAPAAVDGPAGHDVERTLEHVEALSVTIGERVSGSAGEDAAVEYIAAEFRSSGYDVEIVPFEFATGGFSDDTLAAGGTEIASRRFNGSGTNEVAAEAVFVGLADATGLQGKDADRQDCHRRPRDAYVHR